MRALPPILFLALAGCAAPPEGPRLLSPDEIAQAAQGTTAIPDTAPLEARAAGLRARAAAIRRLSVPALDEGDLRSRAGALSRR